MIRTLSFPSALFGEAAARLDGRDASPEASSLLDILGYRTGAASDEEWRQRRHNVALLHLASRFEQIFQLEPPLAPRLFFLGALVGRRAAGLRADRKAPLVSVTGTGLSFRAAFESLAGEAAEFLSQLETGSEPLMTVQPNPGDRGTQFSYRLGHEPSQSPSETTWLKGWRLSDSSECYLLADDCLRRDETLSTSAPLLLSSGMAAGTSRAEATRHAFLELIERDAVGLWWKGGRRGRALDGAIDVGGLLRHLGIGEGGQHRSRWCLDITTDVGICTVVALSCEANGFGLALGAAARPRLADAAWSALRELCQIEASYAIIDEKRRVGGKAAMNERDLRHSRRATEIQARSCALLHPDTSQPIAVHAPLRGDLDSLVARLTRVGIEAAAVDLTRPAINIPAVRVIAPALQLEPSTLTSARLEAAIMETGGGSLYNQGVQLL